MKIKIFGINILCETAANSVNECTNYDTVHRCCPKAQFTWAINYEKDKRISQYLIKSAATKDTWRGR